MTEEHHITVSLKVLRPPACRMFARVMVRAQLRREERTRARTYTVAREMLSPAQGDMRSLREVKREALNDLMWTVQQEIDW